VRACVRACGAGARERVLVVGLGGAVYFWAHELVEGLFTAAATAPPP
jgi:hypothetical protein